MAAAADCFKCKKNPGDVSLSCEKHFVCRDCIVALARANPQTDKAEVYKCPAKECQPSPQVSLVADGSQNVPKFRTYKDALEFKPESPVVADQRHDVSRLASTNEADGRIWIFVHQSNMWIEAKKLYGRQKGFVTDQDHRVRIDMGKLADVLGGGREEVKGKLYGSEPPPIDSVWQRIRERGWEVITSQRSQVTGKEKQVDTKLVADVISLACKTPVHERTTIILVTGDANVIPAIEGVLDQEQWKVEVYMWGNAISNQLRQFAKRQGDRCKVLDLDQYLDKVTFTNMKFWISNPKVRSMVCAFGIVFKMKRGAFSPSRIPTDEWIDNLDGLAQWPSQYYWFDHKTSRKDDLVVVFRPVSGKKFDVAKFLQSVEAPTGSETKYKLPLVQDVQTFIQFITALAREAKQNPALKEFNAVLEQLGIYSHDDVCAGYENEAAFVTINDKTFSKWRISHKKHRPQNRQKYTEQCPNHYNCFYGTRCYYGHSEDETAYFKTRKEARGNPQRKVTLCKAFLNKKCHKKVNECDWAHGEQDAWCKECRKTGHLGTKCPILVPQQTWASII